uniref:Hypothetical conserved protein n=1 Tax=uncultured Chloroflexota bacterium TaxID=166587 RepID=H5SPC6_9CHLR|nr:hypothetical conserved protein [uncultured Chloroflexota bacterium]
MLDPDSTTPIIVLFLLLLLHAFFAAAKEAIVSLRKSRRLQLLEEGHPAAEKLNDLAEDALRLLATEQLTLKFIGFFIIAFAVLVYTPPLAQLLSLNNLAALFMVTVGAVLVTLVFGELVPREIARAFAEPVALWSVYPMYLVSHLALPLARTVTKISLMLTRRSADSQHYQLGLITEEDLRTYVDAGEEGGALNEVEKEMIFSIFSLDDTLAREIMVPRIDMVAVEARTTLMEAIDVILAAGHSRLPVYVENIDNIIGILYVKDLLAHWRHGGETSTVDRLVREVYFVPETKPVSDLLRELQSKKIQIAIVVDEYGGTAGLVTIEDIIEEIVGEIQDEYDTEELFIQRITDDEYIFNARVDLDDINNIMSIDLPTDESDTLGGLIYTLLGRVPEIGDSVEFDNLRLTVLTVEGRRIGTVKIQRLQEDRETPRSAETEATAQKKSSALVGNTPNAVSGST